MGFKEKVKLVLLFSLIFILMSIIVSSVQASCSSWQVSFSYTRCVADTRTEANGGVKRDAYNCGDYSSGDRQETVCARLYAADRDWDFGGFNCHRRRGGFTVPYDGAHQVYKCLGSSYTNTGTSCRGNPGHSGPSNGYYMDDSTCGGQAECPNTLTLGGTTSKTVQIPVPSGVSCSSISSSFTTGSDCFNKRIYASGGKCFLEVTYKCIAADTSSSICGACNYGWVGLGSNYNCCGDGGSSETWCSNNHGCYQGSYQGNCGIDECNVVGNVFSSTGLSTTDNDGCISGKCNIKTYQSVCSGDTLSYANCVGTNYQQTSKNCNDYDHTYQGTDLEANTNYCDNCGEGNSCSSFDYTCSSKYCKEQIMDLDSGEEWCDDCSGTVWGLAGSSNSALTCCGDDANEYVILQKGDNEDFTKKGCCDSPTDCATDSVCYNTNTWMRIGMGGREIDQESNYLCINSEWKDPDNIENIDTYCTTSGSNYKVAGDFCCGDDPLEDNGMTSTNNKYICDVYQDDMPYWHSDVYYSTSRLGRIQLIKGLNKEAFANEDGWKLCDSSTLTNTWSYEEREFICARTQGENSIYECSDSTSFMSDSIHGRQHGDGITIDGQDYFCGTDNKWVQDLDQAGEEACENNGYEWGGDFCCGDDNIDDYNTASQDLRYICDKTSDGEWEAYDAKRTNNIGKIVRLELGTSSILDDYEVVSDSEKWNGCGTSISVKHYGVSDETDITFNFLNINKGEFTHQYICFDAEAHQNTVAECAGFESSLASNTMKKATGESLEISDKHLYCTEYFNWTFNLDVIDNFGDSDGTTCKQARDPEGELSNFIWTGTSCCSESEDEFYENYNDKNGDGACFGGIGSYNNDYAYLATGDSVKELVVYDGEWQGCAIDRSLAGGDEDKEDMLSNAIVKPDKNNKYLLSLADHPDISNTEWVEGDLLVNDHKYCFIVDENNIGDSYYCSYSREWVPTEGKMMNHLSYIEWVPKPGQYPNQMDVNKAGCCTETQCWNGTGCVDDQSNKPTSQPVVGTISEDRKSGYRCIKGEWINMEAKYDFNNYLSGYCPNNADCLVNPNGDINYNYNVVMYDYSNLENPSKTGDNLNMQCVEDQQFIGDNYCDTGKWTSRTRQLALQLLDVADSRDEYSLFCDNYENTLNYLDYDISFIKDYTKEKKKAKDFFERDDYICTYPDGTNAPCVENACVLKYKDSRDNENVVLGFVLNSRNYKVQEEIVMLNSLNKLTDYCEDAQQESENEFFTCENKDVWYNPISDIMIFTKEDSSVTLDEDGSSYFLEYIGNAFKEIYNTIISMKPISDLGLSIKVDFINKTGDYSKVYVAKKEDNQVYAVSETVDKKLSRTNQTIIVKYKGFDPSLCAAIRNYNKYYGNTEYGGGYVYCEETDGEQYLISVDKTAFTTDFWVYLTSRLRIGEKGYTIDDNKCSNGVQDSDESGIDCGGDCNLCVTERDVCEGAQIEETAGSDIACSNLDFIFDGYSSNCCNEYGYCCDTSYTEEDAGISEETDEENLESEDDIQSGENEEDTEQTIAFCENGIMDNGEDGIDCGGGCDPCSIDEDVCEGAQIEEAAGSDIACSNLDFIFDGYSSNCCSEYGYCCSSETETQDEQTTNGNTTEQSEESEESSSTDNQEEPMTDICTNGEKDNDEIGVDCGGSCDSCITEKDVCEGAQLEEDTGSDIACDNLNFIDSSYKSNCCSEHGYCC